MPDYNLDAWLIKIHKIGKQFIIQDLNFKIFMRKSIPCAVSEKFLHKVLFNGIQLALLQWEFRMASILFGMAANKIRTK